LFLKIKYNHKLIYKEDLMKDENKSEELAGFQPVGEKVEKKEESKPKSKQPGRTKLFMQDSLRKIGFAVLFTLIGALLIGITLYLPAQTKFKTALTELDRLQPIEAEYQVLVEEQAINQARTGLYKTLSDTSMLHIVLVNNQPNRINQNVRYVEEDLKNLIIPNFPDLPSTLISQFAEVAIIAASNQLKAIEKLGDFQNDLLLAADNLDK